MTEDRELGEKLRKIENEYLRAPLSEDSKRKPELVSHITERFILPNLREHFSGVAYTGSNYEYTTVPGKSDFDIQFYLKLPNTRSYSATAESFHDPAWMLVRGGPPHLRNSSGNLSTEKARRFIQSKVDQALQSQRSPSFYGEVVEITRSMSGPATTLNVRWRRETLSIDIVICLQASDVGDKNGSPYRYDLVAKPYDEYHCDRDAIWRISYSKQEVDALRNCDERQRVLLRIMKVVKNHQPQLNRFPSYFYKNVLFKLKEDDPWASWERRDLPQRFKDMIETIRDCLRDANLPLHFNKKVNYLKGKSELCNVATYLTNIISRQRYMELLARVPLRAPEIDDVIQGLGNLHFDEPRVYDADQQRAEDRGGWSCCVM